MKLNVTLAFNGNCEEAINFYCKVFNTNTTMIHRYDEMPPNDNFKIDDADLKKIMHSEMKITENLIIMAVDDIMNSKQMGNAIGLCLSYDNTEDLNKAREVFEMLSEDGVVEMPFDKTFWGAYYGIITDKFGIRWEMNYQLEN